MQIKGKLVEVGELEDYEGTGFVLKTAAQGQEFVVVTGLTHAQCREAAEFFGEECTLSLERNENAI